VLCMRRSTTDDARGEANGVGTDPLLAPAPLTAFLHLWQNLGRAAQEASFFCCRPDTRSGWV
jgi:hypothetical protein